MNLTPYVENLRRDLAVAAESGGEEARAAAERITAPLESAIRLMLYEALSDAADEITRELAPEEPEEEPAAGALPAPDGEDAATARINLRLPEQLKSGIEQAASRERLSVNAWLVRAAAAALATDAPDRRAQQRVGGRIGQSYTGWVS